MTLHKFTRELKKLGFHKDYEDKECMSFVKIEAEWGVKLDVQLWRGDWGHRVSHYHHLRADDGTPIIHDGHEDEDGICYGHMDTRPSDFQTLEGMRKAIAFETIRDKHRDRIERDLAINFR